MSEDLGPLFAPFVDTCDIPEDSGTYHEEKTAHCDLCGTHGAGHLHYHMGTPVLFICHNCD